MTKSLRPLAVSDEFDFGLFVCGISSFVGGDTAYWLYKVDHKTARGGRRPVPAQGRRSRCSGTSATRTANVNTGDELVLQAPARAKPDSDVAVRVWSYDSRRQAHARPRAPWCRARTRRPPTPRDGPPSTRPSRGTLRLRAERGADIPSQTVSVCITAKPRCPSRRGKRIFGTAKADRIAGTKGPDTVSAGAGADRVSVRGGGRDTVRCGKGRDRVSADRSDRVGRDCEVVKRG